MPILVRLITCIVVAGLLGCSDELGSDRRLTEACDVTATALRANIPEDGKWVLNPDLRRDGARWRSVEFLLQAPQPNDEPGEYGWYSKGADQRDRGPSVEMARAFAETEPVSGALCPEVSALAKDSDARFEAAAPQTTPDEPGQPFPRASIRLERAVLSPTGQEAIVLVGRQFAPLAGGGFLILYRRSDDGTWLEASRLLLWVS